MLIVFTLVRPVMKAALSNSTRAASVHVVADEALPLPMPNRAALAAPRSTERLDTARSVAKQNPAAVANIVREWVKGDAS